MQIIRGTRLHSIRSAACHRRPFHISKKQSIRPLEFRRRIAWYRGVSLGTAQSTHPIFT